MAVIGNTALTLADWAAREGVASGVDTIVDLLSQNNPMLQDMPWIEANMVDGHKTTIRTGLPSGTWRMLYQGVLPSKSTTAQIKESTGRLEAYSQMDKQLADLNGNTAQFRLTEDSAFYEGLGQQMSSAIFYSNSLQTPEQIMGFAPRFSALQNSAANGYNVIDAGGTGTTNTSIWIIGWGPNTVHGLFPKGSQAGLQHRDLGEHTLFDANGNPFQGYRSHFTWDAGLCVRDWRFVTRICNVDVTKLEDAVNAPDIRRLLIKAFGRMPAPPAGTAMAREGDPNMAGIVGPATKFMIYCNRAVATALDLMALNTNNLLLQYSEYQGRPVTNFRGVPIRIQDSILSTEARVV